MECVARYGTWGGNKLITYSDYNLFTKVPNYQTKICVWNTDGKLLGQSALELSWRSASQEFLDAQIGLFPRDNTILYTYNNHDISEKGGCYLHLQDINNPGRNKRIRVGDADSENSCRDTKMDLQNTTFGSISVPTRK